MKRIVVGMDRSPGFRAPLAWALNLALARQPAAIDEGR